MAKKTSAKTEAAAPGAPNPPIAPSSAPKRLVAKVRPAESALPKQKAAPTPPSAPRSSDLPVSAALGQSLSKAKATARKPGASARKSIDPVAPAPAAPKRAAVKTRARSSAKSGAKKSLPPSPTHEEIAIRAYLISEKRHHHGLHAEPHEDWAEAERQLWSERKETYSAV